MSTDIDWQHELDSSFGTGHDLPPGHYVAAGRTAVRRRRATAVVLAAAVVIGGGTAWAVAPDPSVRGDAPIATSGPAPQQDERTDAKEDRTRDRDRPRSVPSMSVEEEFTGNPAIIEPDGTLKISPLTDRILQRVPNPMDYTPVQGASVGLRVVYQGVEQYSLIATTADGSVSTHTNSASGDFTGWLAAKVQLQQGLDRANGVTGAPASADSTDPGTWLRLDDRGLVAATEGNVLLEVRVDVDLGDGFALGADRTGAARMLVAGRPEHVAYRVVDGRLDVISGPGSFDSLDAFLTWARQQYASGEGMR